MSELIYCPEHRTIVSIRPVDKPRWCCEVAALEATNAALLEASKEAYDILYNIPEDLSNWQTTNASIQEAHDILEEAIRKAKSHADTLKGG